MRSNSGSPGFSRPTGAGARFRPSKISPGCRRETVARQRPFRTTRCRTRKVGAGVKVLRSHLLGRHVRDGSKRAPRTRQAVDRRHVGRASSPPPAARTLASPKSRIFACPRAVTKRFAGLMSRWTMPAVCAASSASAISIANASSRFDLERAPCDPMLQRRPVEKLHDEKRAAVLLADIVDRADVGVVQRRCRSRLAAESCQRFGIPRELSATGTSARQTDAAARPRPCRRRPCRRHPASR